jgi:ABC-type glycerol-3-phosphate transport system substrate-binding protein
VDVADDDFVYKNNIYAKPLYCDTLALYYNNDLLNQRGIASPPKTWDELKKDTQLLTEVDKYGNIKQSGIALGRSENPGAVNRAGDIMMLLMLQGGAVMNNENSLEADFSNSKFPNVNPGIGALKFFTSFSDGASPYYSWNAKQDYSVDSFRYGRTAMMLNYSYWYDRLRRSDPKLDFNIAQVPQTNLNSNNIVNFASYWGLAVTKNRRIAVDANYNEADRIKQAWNYIHFITNTANQNGGYDATAVYLKNTHKPPARRDLVEVMKNDVSLGVFAQQALTAKSWRQVDNDAIDKIFKEMIDVVNRGAMTINAAVLTAEERVNSLIRK